MRKANALLSMGILALFLVHAVLGGFQLAGILQGGSRILMILAWLMTALIAAHTVLGCILTVQTLSAQKKSGAAYLKENRLFWTRRISGFAVMLLILTHIVIFLGNSESGVYRLNLFGTVQMISQILLVLAIAVHVLTNIKPLMIALGVRGFREFFTDILLVISVLLCFCGIAFLIYYLRWQQI